MSTLLPALPPIDTTPIDQQNQSALQDALQQYQQAQANGVPGMASKVAAAQSALSNYGTSIPATPTIPSLDGLSAPTYTPEASGVAAATGSVPANTSASGSAAGSTGLSSVLYTSRLIVLIVGVLLIAAGLFSFKTTQNVIAAGSRLAE